MEPDDVPTEFLDPEGDGEAQDPDLILEATTATLRKQWHEWMCRKGGGAFADITFFGRRIGGVPAPAVDAYRALEQALKSAGYAATSCWAYNCRLTPAPTTCHFTRSGSRSTSTPPRTRSAPEIRSPENSARCM